MQEPGAGNSRDPSYPKPEGAEDTRELEPDGAGEPLIVAALGCLSGPHRKVLGQETPSLWSPAVRPRLPLHAFPTGQLPGAQEGQRTGEGVEETRHTSHCPSQQCNDSTSDCSSGV